MGTEGTSRLPVTLNLRRGYHGEAISTYQHRLSRRELACQVSRSSVIFPSQLDRFEVLIFITQYLNVFGDYLPKE